MRFHGGLYEAFELFENFEDFSGLEPGKLDMKRGVCSFSAYKEVYEVYKFI
jgi:hypothetical protein